MQHATRQTIVWKLHKSPHCARNSSSRSNLAKTTSSSSIEQCAWNLDSNRIKASQKTFATSHSYTCSPSLSLGLSVSLPFSPCRLANFVTLNKHLVNNDMQKQKKKKQQQNKKRSHNRSYRKCSLVSCISLDIVRGDRKAGSRETLLHFLYVPNPPKKNPFNVFTQQQQQISIVEQSELFTWALAKATIKTTSASLLSSSSVFPRFSSYPLFTSFALLSLSLSSPLPLSPLLLWFLSSLLPLFSSPTLRPSFSCFYSVLSSFNASSVIAHIYKLQMYLQLAKRSSSVVIIIIILLIHIICKCLGLSLRLRLLLWHFMSSI